VPNALRLAALCHLVMLLFLGAMPFVEFVGGPPVTLGWPFAVGVCAVAALLTYEHAIVRPTDLTRVNTAFFQVNAIVSLGLFGIVLLDLYCL
jgi:4-hydroxybenzoate polyprenyltransferase